MKHTINALILTLLSSNLVFAQQLANNLYRSIAVAALDSYNSGMPVSTEVDSQCLKFGISEMTQIPACELVRLVRSIQKGTDGSPAARAEKVNAIVSVGDRFRVLNLGSVNPPIQDYLSRRSPTSGMNYSVQEIRERTSAQLGAARVAHAKAVAVMATAQDMDSKAWSGQANKKYDSYVAPDGNTFYRIKDGSVNVTIVRLANGKILNFSPRRGEYEESAPRVSKPINIEPARPIQRSLTTVAILQTAFFGK